jgi:hypothetical protein
MDVTIGQEFDTKNYFEQKNILCVETYKRNKYFACHLKYLGIGSNGEFLE